MELGGGSVGMWGGVDSSPLGRTGLLMRMTSPFRRSDAALYMERARIVTGREEVVTEYSIERRSRLWVRMQQFLNESLGLLRHVCM